MYEGLGSNPVLTRPSLAYTYNQVHQAKWESRWAVFAQNRRMRTGWLFLKGCLQTINISLHCLPFRFACREEVSNVVLAQVLVKYTFVRFGRHQQTRSVTPRCLSNSSRANFRVSARVVGSWIRRVARRMVRYSARARDLWRN